MQRYDVPDKRADEVRVTYTGWSKKNIFFLTVEKTEKHSRVELSGPEGKVAQRGEGTSSFEESNR